MKKIIISLIAFLIIILVAIGIFTKEEKNTNLKKIVVVKPGITGYWQVNREKNESFYARPPSVSEK